MTDGVCEKGRVAAVEADGTITIAFARREQCQHCSGGCLNSGNQMLLTLKTAEPFNEGDEVSAVLEEGAVLKASFLAYGLPLFAFMVGVLAGGLLMGEAMGVIAGILSAGTVFLLVGALTRKKGPQWRIERL